LFYGEKGRKEEQKKKKSKREHLETKPRAAQVLESGWLGRER
jgi:hypothetical protein